MYGGDAFSYNFTAALEAAAGPPRLSRDELQHLSEDLYMRKFNAGEFAPTVSYGYGYPTKAKNGKVIRITQPTREQLEKHRRLYGAECVEIPDESRTVHELRDDGLSVREISSTLGMTERSVKARLRLAA